jgi:dephospho-CoA kinase
VRPSTPATRSIRRPPTRHSRPKRQSLKSTNRRIDIALTGGIGAGKSEALKAFARHGAAVISSDEIVHRLLREDEEVHRELTARLGADVIGADGADRGRIAEIVFADPEQLEWLEALLHPRVVREYLAWRDEQTTAVTVSEIPLLYETGGEERFDHVVVITAPPEVRARRARVAPAERERRLLPEDEKVRRADFVYVNDGSLAELDAFVADVLARVS